MKTNYKKVIGVIILSILLIGSWNESFAQPTNKINYQAVARNTSGNALVNQNISVRLSILNGSGGPSLYTETFNLSTNGFGLFTVQIGGGLLVSGNYNTINWSAGNQWLKVEMDPTGGSSYVNMGESQLLSVPYALYSANGLSAGTSAGNTQYWDGTAWANDSNIYNNGGDVGIGISNPSTKLSVHKEFATTNTIENVLSVMRGTSGTAASGIGTSLTFWNETSNAGYSLSSQINSLFEDPAVGVRLGAMDFRIRNGNAINSAMYMKADGNVGIGTVNPLARLHLVSSVNPAMIIDGAASMYAGIYEGGTYRGYIGSYAGIAEDVDFGTGNGNTTGSVHLTIEGVPVLTVDENEIVGIGTTTPSGSAKLEVNGGTVLVNATGPRFYEIRRGGAHRWAIREDAGTGMEFYQIYNDAGSLINTTRMSVADNGRVGVGTLAAAPLSTFNVSHVTGSLTEGMSLTNSSASSTWYFYSSNLGNLIIGKASNLGQFDGVTGVYTNLSDARKKTEIHSLSSVMPSVMSLDIKHYEYRHNNPQHRKSIGLIAQEVVPYFPELVYNLRDDAEGVDYLSLDYSGFGVIALKAIQEQQKMIEELKAEVKALKSGQTGKK